MILSRLASNNPPIVRGDRDRDPPVTGVSRATVCARRRGVKQIELTEKQVSGFIAAQNDLQRYRPNCWKAETSLTML